MIRTKILDTRCLTSVYFVTWWNGPISWSSKRQATIATSTAKAIKLASDPVKHSRAKHIDIQYHKVRELISDAALELNYIETSKMVADGLTKPLTLVKHEYFITMLGLAEKSKELAQIG